MIFFSVLGNHEDPKGNPIGYTRMTQRGKWVKPEAQRYEAWKDYVWASLLKTYPQPPRFENGQKIHLDCYIEYRNKRRSDPGNVAKGIADALADRKHRSKQGTWVERRLYPNDRNVLERAMDFSYSKRPGVLVIITEA